MYIYVNLILLGRFLEFLIILVSVVCGVYAIKIGHQENEEIEERKERLRKEAYEKVMNNRES